MTNRDKAVVEAIAMRRQVAEAAIPDVKAEIQEQLDKLRLASMAAYSFSFCPIYVIRIQALREELKMWERIAACPSPDMAEKGLPIEAA
jgi:hypothetical protein